MFIPEVHRALAQYRRFPLAANLVEQICPAIETVAPALEHAVVVPLGRLLRRVRIDLPIAQLRHDRVTPEGCSAQDAATQWARPLHVLSTEYESVGYFGCQQILQRFLIRPITEAAVCIALRAIHHWADMLG